MDIGALLEKYDARVPRYTSYPTAPQFGPAVDGVRYAGWLADLPAEAPVSLYLHVPFCAQLCWYCACHTAAVTSRAPMDSYADTLLREIDLVAAAVGRRLPVSHVHWGGGTPHALPPDRLLQVMRHLREAFGFADGQKSRWRSTRAPPGRRSRRWRRWASPAPRSACRISIRRCSAPSTASRVLPTPPHVPPGSARSE